MATKALALTLISILILFFGRILVNGIEHQRYLNEFTRRCENSGGVVDIPRGSSGWPIPKCVRPDFIIDVGVWSSENPSDNAT